MADMMIEGPAGLIEADIQAVEKPDAPMAIICHPHPLFGGTMNNKVVTTLARTFHECGAHVVRFNFRGVGKSEGQHDEGRGEFQDLLAVYEHVRTEFPGSKLWLAGFSFGGWIATKGALQLSPEKLVLVAPMVSRLREENISALSCPWILVQGEQDEVVDPAEVFAWVNSLPENQKPVLIRLPEAGHFFHGQLQVLRERLKGVLSIRSQQK